MSIAVALSTAAEGRSTIVVAVLMASFMQSVALSIPNAALLYLQGTLSMADDEVGWVFTAYIAASVVTMPMTRWLAGRYGRKTIYLLSIAIFAVGLGTRGACDDSDCNLLPPASSKAAQAAP